ncbi:MAG: DUF4091 domain-containing protein [Thermoguttaceae bacterium]|nr:DUF4091 domain-containing protein [Thermoguttaceae bacterium]MDW8079236.1 DUF4091 domain-containing protein [Thermoguttaceae bacterium]
MARCVRQTLLILSALAASLWLGFIRQALPEEVRLPVVRDTWVSSFGKEVDCNLGAAPRLKLKSYQEMAIVDIDVDKIRGRIVEAAWLHLRLAGSERLHRVTVSSISVPWVEGTSPHYQPEKGSSCFAWRQYPDLPWAYPGSDLSAVVLGLGGSRWAMADASEPDPAGWQVVPVDPLVVATRVAGLSHGFLVFDDTGTEWRRDGERFELRPFPNRYVYSRNGPADSTPYFVIKLGAEDKVPPPPPQELQQVDEVLPPGEAIVQWQVPEDPPPGRTLGFLAFVDNHPVPQYLVPLANRPGTRLRVRLRDLQLPPGGTVELSLVAVDAAGNQSQPASVKLRVSNYKWPELKPFATEAEGGGPITPPLRKGQEPPSEPDFSQVLPQLPTLGRARIAVVDEQDKIHPLTGQMIPPQEPAYLLRNHLWDAKRRVIALQAARNEFVAFQIIVFGEVRGVRPTLNFSDQARGVRSRFGQLWLVNTKEGPLGDPVVPLSGPVDFPITNQGNKPGAFPAKISTMLCELYVPHQIPPGLHRGELALRTGSEVLRLDLLLTVWNFTLADFLSFLPEMNCYGLPQNERDYYRLAHEHRTVLNRLPYSQRGSVAPGCAPEWDGRTLDWREWDKRFGPLLDGSAFADLPRRGVPVEVFYLPLHENWPTPIDPHYNGSYWADEAFTAEYRRAFVEVCQQFARHIEERRWYDTIFQCYLNNKVDYKRSGWSRGSSPWLLDEPAHFQDFWALRFFGEAFHEGLRRAFPTGECRARLVFRCDISRPQWQRNALDHVLDYNVVNGGVFRRYQRLVFDRKQALGHIVLDYGTANAVRESNVQPVAWCWDSWTLGSDGVIPWQTIGRAESWLQDDPLALFYPGEAVGQKGPVASIRLKAFRRGQQDAEYLTLLSEVLGQPRWAVGAMVRRELELPARWEATETTDAEDAGRGSFGQLRPQDFWRLRVTVARMIDPFGPAPKRRLVDFRTPPRNPELRPIGGKVTAAAP